MRKTFSWALAAALLFTACSKGSDNPLLEINDGQFFQVMNFNHEKFFGLDCPALFFNLPLTRPVEPDDQATCVKKVKERVAKLGVSTLVETKHLEDPKVKERYFSLKK